LKKRVLAASLLLSTAFAPHARPAAKDLGRGEEIKNVEVMDPTMRVVDARRYMIQFNTALGVQCRDCHVLRDFASDEKPLTLVAREMMKMQVEINENWFPGRGEVVTCWSCHRGGGVWLARQPSWRRRSSPVCKLPRNGFVTFVGCRESWIPTRRIT
jgi:hypothetical protein